MPFRKISLMLALAFVFGALAAACGGAQEDAAEEGEAVGGGDLTVGYIEWDENVAVSNVMKILLEEELGYDNAELQLADVGPLFQGVSDGSIDAFLDVWLPGTHEQYWEQHEDGVVDLGVWYEGEADLGIAVPEYVEAQSIEDLAGSDEFGNQIVGIEPGSGIMSTVADDAIPEYGLDDYDLVDSSTPAMLAELESAIDSEEPVAVTAWQPHWMFTAYDIRYLEDPEGAMGGAEELSSIAREGLEEEEPVAFALLDTYTLTEEELGDLNLMVHQEADSPEEGAQQWIDENEDVIQPWLDAAQDAA